MLQSPTKRARILVVDDEPTLRLGFSFALKTEEHEVATASNGREALALLDEHSYDLIVMDLRMPELDGIETLKAIRANELHNHIPVILCSAHINASHLLTALNHICYDFLAKPVGPAELRKATQAVLSPSPDDHLHQAKNALRGKNWKEAIVELGKLPGGHPAKEVLLRVAREASRGVLLTAETLPETQAFFSNA